MTTLQILRAARDLISDPERHTRGANARNAEGNPVPPQSPESVCYCMVGALLKFDPVGPKGMAALGFLRAALPYSFDHISTLNDHWPLRHALDAYDRAILAAEVEASA